MTKRWKSSESTVTSLYYHLLWCPKYQREVLVDDVAVRLKELLDEKAKTIDLEIVSYEIMPDCVHLLVRARPEDSPHFLIQQLKSYTSHAMRIEFPSLKSRLPTLWTRNYYCCTVGRFSDDDINRFIESQRNI
ncbi:MAG: IS200/IS605 family transposase [Sphaerochaetaceae bacterium]|jgi:putative transposase|nr:IS200/IS605 family transposase [Sphaerochaetaceae bacterium]